MSNSAATAANTADAEEVQRKFDLGIWYTLFNWANLTVAVQNQWGGPSSADKRDWLAGAISEIFAENPETDTEDVEVVLLQAMEDEFGVRIEDETEVPVARDILKIRQETLRGEFETVDALQKRWEERQGREIATGGVSVVEKEQEGDWDSVDEESDSDENMEDAPPLAPVQPKAKPAPEIDDDGFEKVVRKGRK